MNQNEKNVFYDVKTWMEGVKYITALFLKADRRLSSKVYSAYASNLVMTSSNLPIIIFDVWILINSSEALSPAFLLQVFKNWIFF